MSKYTILLLFFFVLQISAKDDLDVFLKFKSDFGKNYDSAEEQATK